MKTNLIFAIGVMCFGSSGCLATITPSGSVHAHYWTSPVIVEEAPIVRVQPVSIVVTERPHPRPLLWVSSRHVKPLRHRSAKPRRPITAPHRR